MLWTYILFLKNWEWNATVMISIQSWWQNSPFLLASTAILHLWINPKKCSKHLHIITKLPKWTLNYLFTQLSPTIFAKNLLCEPPHSSPTNQRVFVSFMQFLQHQHPTAMKKSIYLYQNPSTKTFIKQFCLNSKFLSKINASNIVWLCFI